MHLNPTLNTWKCRNRHSAGECTGILPLTHEWTEIIIPQVNAPESYPSHMKHRDHYPSSEYTEILPPTHECTEIIIPQVNAPESYPSHMNAPRSLLFKTMYQNPTPHTWIHQNGQSSSKCKRILPLTHENTEIVSPQVNAPESYPSHMKASKSSSLK